MSLNRNEIVSDKPKGKDFGRLEDGPVLARIVSVIDLGLQEQTDWKTKEKTDPKKIVMITYETPDEMITYEKGGEEVTKPRWISKDYTLSFHEKSALTSLVDALNPNLQSLDELLNVPCMVTIGSTSTGNAKVISVAKPMKGAVVGELQSDTFHFDFSHPDMELFDALLEWQQNKIKSALDYNGFADNVSPRTGTNDF